MDALRTRAVTIGRAAAIGASLAIAAATCALVGCRRDEPIVPRTTRLDVRPLTPQPGEIVMPLRAGSVRFAAIGDSGRGDDPQFQVARQMVEWRGRFPFEFVLMLGDNIYGPHTPEDYRRKFDEPYRDLLHAGVTFHAAIGNHDEPGSLNYAPFNMDGQRYYTFRKGEASLGGLTGAGVRFFAMDSRSFDRDQIDWLHRELVDSRSEWKIAYFHHPLYTSGRYQAGARTLRRAVERTLVDGDVDVVLSGHEHFYERTYPQNGIVYFVSGAAGSLRPGDIQRTPLTAAGFDDDYHFVMFEVTGRELYFQAVSRAGKTIDAGVIVKPE
jgi:3',5'-cyclic AMP phosphodiesterase CpdA